MDDDVRCPRCATTKYRNPSLKLMVNVCGHALCENCVDLLFVKGSGICPTCGNQLRRNNFRQQLFEDEFIEKEVSIRRKVLRDFNLKEEDFESLNDYNKYLEEVEDVIYNLVNNIDVPATNKRIDDFKTGNAAKIAKNRDKLGKDDELIEELLEREKEEESLRKRILNEEEKESLKAKLRQKEALVDELMFSDLPANQILRTHANVTKPATTMQNIRSGQIAHSKMFSTGIKLGKGESVFHPPLQTSEGVLYKYTTPHFDIDGPSCPTFEDLEKKEYLNHVRSPTKAEKAGGFLPHYPSLRAIQEAFCGLYFQST